MFIGHRPWEVCTGNAPTAPPPLAGGFKKLQCRKLPRFALSRPSSVFYLSDCFFPLVFSDWYFFELYFLLCIVFYVFDLYFPICIFRIVLPVCVSRFKFSSLYFLICSSPTCIFRFVVPGSRCCVGLGEIFSELYFSDL